MKIESIRIENFRSFKDETILLDDYTCFVGPNGAGKSTILCALNIFFRQFKDAKTYLSKLSIDDFHHKNTDAPIKITVTFTDLSIEAQRDLSDYVRLNKLIVSSVATYDSLSERAEVKQYGNRLGIADFRKYFEAEKNQATATELKDIYLQLTQAHPNLTPAKTKPDMAEGLRSYEASHQELCTLIPSEDQFYGASKGANRLSPHVQWVFVSAAKDFTEEGDETKNSALGQLLTRTIRSKINFSEKVDSLRQRIQMEYQDILENEQKVLDELSNSLQVKLKSWAHPNATAKVLWKQDTEKSIRVEEPWAHIKIGEKGFESEIVRFGHGMQRSLMLTLLQEIASINDQGSPTLIMGIEEPELYQHPPQARYLADVLQDLANLGTQVILCSHSPLFIPGDNFEAVRLVKEVISERTSSVNQIKYSDLDAALVRAGQKLLKESGILAKLYPSLNPVVSEMFFCKVLILTEGYEDVAYISSYLALNNQLEKFRRNGCHIVPVGGKSELIKPLAMANLLKIPTFVICDADTNIEKESEKNAHKIDNRAILNLLNHETENEWPNACIKKNNLYMWKNDIGDSIESELGDKWRTCFDQARAYYSNAKSLTKNPLAVSKALEIAWEKGVKSSQLIEAVDNLISFSDHAY